MKQLFTLIAAMAVTMTINAQVISFGDKSVANDDLPGAWTTGNVKLVMTDDGKFSIDTNKAYFGIADDFTPFSTRLKTGGKSSSKRFLTLTVPLQRHGEGCRPHGKEFRQHPHPRANTKRNRACEQSTRRSRSHHGG